MHYANLSYSQLQRCNFANVQFLRTNLHGSKEADCHWGGSNTAELLLTDPDQQALDKKLADYGVSA